jgi:uroporphyrinogen decarboxylase
MMRQAGRYHKHYQGLRARHTFMELCKVPELACEVTLGPVEDFGFDAAILFSDLLFPLEALGMGLRYDEGPVLDWHLSSPGDVTRLKESPAGFFDFQGQALRLVRQRLSPEKGLIGFVGAPLTLFVYAVAGTHLKGAPSLDDGRFEGFCERLLPVVLEEMVVQAKAGADVIAVFDTAAGEVDPALYRTRVVPWLAALLESFARRAPGVPVTYYSKGTGPEHWRGLERLPIDCLGVDWRHDLGRVLEDWGGRFAIQGNVDPSWLRELGADELETRLRGVFAGVKGLPARARQGWVCGLGHGVLPGTPEENVRLFLRVQHEVFS